MANREELALRLERAIGDWDVHIDRCRECLSHGVHLCFDGEHTALRIDTARSRLAGFDVRLAELASRRTATARRPRFGLPTTG